MVLELHVWGPAFGLPSLDPECLAAIAYFTQSLDRSEWTVVHSSPSAVPTRRLPTLHNPKTGSWTPGLPSILSTLAADRPPSFADPDSGLTRDQLATSTAYLSHVRASLAPLLSLSLYASTANWTAATRPAYSASGSVPFPLGWTEVPALRRAWIALSAGCGVDLLDAEDAERPPSPPAPSGLPPGLPKKEGVRDRLSPEQRARIKLERLVAEALDVLADLKPDEQQRWFLADGGAGPTVLDCVAFGYLALMICPDLPRPWLRDTVAARYPALQAFVGDMTAVCFGDAVPTRPPARGDADVLGVAGRFADGAVRNVPWLGGEWRRWRDVGVGPRDALVMVAGALAAVALVGGLLLKRRGVAVLPVLGSSMHRWQRERGGLASFGAAGALLGGLFRPEVRFGGGGGCGDWGGQQGRIQTEVESPFGGKGNGVEVDVSVDVD